MFLAVDNPKNNEHQVYLDRLSRLIDGDKKFLTVRECLVDEYLHRHYLLAITRSIRHGEGPYVYIPPIAEEVGTSVDRIETSLALPLNPIGVPSPSSTQDDILANIHAKERHRYITTEDAVTPKKQPSPGTPPPSETQVGEALVDDSIHQGLGRLPLSDTFYTEHDFGT